MDQFQWDFWIFSFIPWNEPQSQEKWDWDLTTVTPGSLLDLQCCHTGSPSPPAGSPQVNSPYRFTGVGWRVFFLNCYRRLMDVRIATIKLEFFESSLVVAVGEHAQNLAIKSTIWIESSGVENVWQDAHTTNVHRLCRYSDVEKNSFTNVRKRVFKMVIFVIPICEVLR